jgi:hypothetical protein
MLPMNQLELQAEKKNFISKAILYQHIKIINIVLYILHIMHDSLYLIHIQKAQVVTDHPCIRIFSKAQCLFTLLMNQLELETAKKNSYILAQQFYITVTKLSVRYTILYMYNSLIACVQLPTLHI